MPGLNSPHYQPRLNSVEIDSMNAFTRLVRDDGGATMVEYSIMVALIATVCIAVVSTLGKTTSNEFSGVNSAL